MLLRAGPPWMPGKLQAKCTAAAQAESSFKATRLGGTIQKIFQLRRKYDSVYRMMETREARSQASHATAELRKKIIECQMPPGKRLHIASLAEEIDVSPGAVREALSRLSSEHLVTAIDQRGFRVNHLSVDDMRDIYQTRAKVEEDAVRLSVKAGGAEWRTLLENAYLKMQAYGGRPIQHVAADVHEEFHRILVSACPSHWSLRLFNLLYSASDRYRNFAVFKLAKERDSSAEHQRIFEAAMDKDGDLAGLLARRHVERTRDILSVVLSGQLVPEE